jgi:hypothetical protein
MTIAQTPKTHKKGAGGAPATQPTAETKPRPVHVAVAGNGDALTIPLEVEGDRAFAVLTIDGVHYHLERVPKEELVRDYKVDLDPDYEPQADATGYCYMLVPFSR